jgi:uncharacterized protein YceK
MKIVKKLLINCLVTGLITVLSGCGTISRGDSISRSYRGFDRDKEVASNPYFWMFSFGLAPIFHIISMPVDIVVDTLLYPYDVHQYNLLKERVRKQQEPVGETDNTLPESAHH